MKASVLVAAVLLGAGMGVCSAPASPHRVFVSATASFAWSREAHSARPEQRFTSLHQWQAAAAAAAARGGGVARPTEVMLGPGLHEGPLRLVGPGAANTTIQGVGPQATTVSTGVRVDGWAPDSLARLNLSMPAPRGEVWSAPMPARLQGAWINQLFVQEASPAGLAFSRRLTARSKELVYNHTDMRNPKYNIVFFPGQVPSSFHNQDRVLATLYHCWTATSHRIRAITPGNNTLSLLRAPHQDIPRCEHASGKRFFVENAVEYLAPGTFYADAAANKIMYMPLPGETRDAFIAYAPNSTTVLEIADTAGVHVTNLSLAHTKVDLSGFFEGDCDGQSASNLKSSAVALNNASDVTLDWLEVAHTGGTGIWPNVSCTNVEIDHCEVHDTGAGAVRIGHDQRTDTPPPTKDVKLTNCELHDGGYVYIMGPGLLLTGCTDCRIEHNDIHHFFYSGISTGYAFSEAPQAITNTTVAYNHLHILGQGRLSDMGCLYTWGGLQPGLHVDHNLCHNVSHFAYGGWGFYTDQTTEYPRFTNNICHATDDACFHNHEGFNVNVQNNIFVHNRGPGSTEGALTSASPTSSWHAAFNFSLNIVVAIGDTAMFTDDDSATPWQLSTFDRNVYWRQGQPVTFPGNLTLAQWQATGGDKHHGEDQQSVVADPLLRPDFSLDPHSPALALGFKPIDTSQIGPQP